MVPATTYSFETKVASRGYYADKSTTRVNPKEGNEVKVEIEAKKFNIS